MAFGALLAVFLSAFAAPAAADAVVASSSGPLTLPQCIQTALAAAPTVRAAETRAEQSRRLWYRSLAAFSPQATFTGSDVFAGYDNNGNLISRPRYDSATHVYNMAASWNFFNDGNDWRAQKQAKLDERSSKEDLEAARQDLLLATVQAYFGELLAQRLLALAHGFLDAQTDHLNVTDQLYRSGVRSYTDLLDARIQTRERELSVVSAELAERSARGALNLVLERPLEQELSLLDVSGTPTVPGDGSSDLETALAARPDAQKARLGMEKQRIAVTNSWAALLPALTVAGSLGYRFDDPIYTIAPGVTVAATNPDYQAVATVTVPIFDGFARWQDVRDSKLGLEALRDDWETLRRQIASELLSARDGLEQTRRSYELSRDETKTAEEELGILLDQYRDGTATAVQVRDARNDLLQLEQAQANSLYQYHIGRAQLLRVTGTLGPESFE